MFNGAILQQAFVVEFVVEDHMCPDCTRRAVNPNQWVACAPGTRCQSPHPEIILLTLLFTSTPNSLLPTACWSSGVLSTDVHPVDARCVNYVPRSLETCQQ